MMDTNKIVVEANFYTTCELFYSLASKRIERKYLQWIEDRNGQNATHTDFYPQNRNLFSNILQGKRTDDNPYLITPKIIPTLLNELDFNDVNEIFWGDDISLYFEDLFYCLINDMKDFPEYTKNWGGLKIASEYEIKKFYQSFFVEDNQKIEVLKDSFIDFTYNNYHELKVLDVDGTIQIIEQDSLVESKNNYELLTFKNLPDKIKIFAENIFLPQINDIRINTLIKNSMELND